MSQEWRAWSREKLEREYAPSQWAKQSYADYAPLLQAASDLARSTLASKLNIDRYGSRQRNQIAWSPPTSRDQIFVWIHGGYWQGSSISEALVGADDLVERGFGYAAIEYTLAPEISVRQIVDECAAALDWIRDRNDGKSIIIGGHSAGAHLALSVAQRSQVSGLVLVSGVFDLRPISHTTINEPLGLTEADAIEASPIFAPFPFACAAEVMVGGEESPSYHSQAIAAFDYLVDKESRAQLITIDGLDHFDIILSGQHLKSFLRLADC